MGGGPPNVLLFILPLPEPKDSIAKLKRRFPDYEIAYVQTSSAPGLAPAALAEVPENLWQNVTVLVSLFAFPQPAQAPRLSLVHLISAGSNQIQKQPLYTDTDVIITTSSGIHGPQIAEWVVMTGLVASHKYQRLYELQKEHSWGQSGNRDDFRTVIDQVGRRLGVLGYGSIGRQVARVAKAMGMEVVAYTATPKDTAEKRKDHGFIIPGTGDPDGSIPVEWHSGLDAASRQHFLAQNLDWLLVSVPLTEQTRHFLSTPEFRALSQDGKKPAFLTNIARGEIIDQPKLIEALKDSTLSGAALDVTDPEPLPADSELWDLENVIVTPHVSGIGSNYIERTLKILEINLERRERGEKLLNIVRRERGY